MAIGGGMSCVKYLLFCFNLLFAVTGLIILIAGIKSQIDAHPYQQYTDGSFFMSASIVLIIMGIIIFVIAFFGCCGAAKENHCMIITFSVLLTIVFVVELSVGIAAYVKRHDLEDVIMKQVTVKDYNTNEEFKKSFDILQTDLQCCGVTGPGDWANYSMPIPSSCCTAQEIKGEVVAECKDTPENPNFHHKGCLSALVEYLKSVALVLGGVGIGISFVQLLGVVFACCLARSIRTQYETV